MSERDLSSDVLLAIVEGTVKPAVFVFADIPSEPRYLWTGRGDVTWGGFTWKGVGGLISFSTVSETTDTAVRGIKAKMNALDSDLISDIIGDNYQGRAAVLYIGFYRLSDNVLLVEPQPLWKGILETDEIEDDASQPVLEISAEHRLSDILRKREIRYTDQDQQYLHPGDGDTGLNKVETIQDVSVPWGRTQK